MIYIKEGDFYFKYHTSEDGKFICTAKDKTESIILYEISGEFDGVITPDKKVHFVLQGLNGELIYLKKENGTWKKYNIFKSKKGVRKISGIKLAVQKDTLCAFYIMNHSGKNLLVKHVFSVDDMFKEPEVLGVTDARRDFVLAKGQAQYTTVFYKNAEGEHRKLLFDKDFKNLKDEKLNTESGILWLNAICSGDKTYLLYTAARKNSTALVFCNDNNLNEGKIVTFGVARNCAAHIFLKKDTIVAQWEENGAIMQSESADFGMNFSRPKSLGGECHFAKIRHIQNDEELICDKCAVYNMEPYVYAKKQDRTASKKGVSKPLTENRYFKKEINTAVTNEQILDKLNEVKTDIDKMGKSLIAMCSFLEDIKNFKDDAILSKPLAPHNLPSENLSGEDIGEVNEDNLKLFESTDIDTVLPENNG